MSQRRPILSHWTLLVAAAFSLHSVILCAQTPVPFVNAPLIPSSVSPGGAGFTLIVNGTGFVAGSIVDWNRSAKPTTFVSGSKLTAAISATDIATAGTASVSVINPAPGGGTSNVSYFEITLPPRNCCSILPMSRRAMADWAVS